MKIRAIALALPLMVGVACKTSSTQSGSRTAGTEPQQGGATAGAQAGAGGASAGGTVSGSTTETPSASGGVSTPGTSSGTGGTASGDVYGTPRTGSDASAGGTTGSGDVRGHSDDQVVSGKITRLSSRMVTITASDGTQTELQIAPETTIQVDGQDARSSDLQEGQPVRASFSTVEDQDVAVEIHAGQDAGSMHEPGSMHDQMHDPGSTGAGTKDSGTSSPSPSTGSDRKY